MAYFTGKDVDVWVTTEHENDYIYVDAGVLKVGVGNGTAGNNITSTTLFSGALNQAGKSNNRLTDVSGCDVTVGAVDEDISFFGLRNVGKIEVKKDTSVSITRKKSIIRCTCLINCRRRLTIVYERNRIIKLKHK